MQSDIDETINGQMEHNSHAHLNCGICEQIIAFLHEKNYRRVGCLPLRKYTPTSFVFWMNEIGVFSRFLARQSNLFAISINPSMYDSFFFDKKVLLLRDMFFLNEALDISRWLDMFHEDWFRTWQDEGLLQEEGNGKLRFWYRIVPYNRSYLVTSRFDRSDPHFTYLSYDSLYFSSFLSKRLATLCLSGSSALDMCCGVGVQALTISPYCRKVIGMDLNPSAIKLSKFNALLNKTDNCEFRDGDISQGVEGKFDLIVSNPPFIYSTKNTSEMPDSSGGEPFGLGVTIDIVRRAAALMKNHGRMFLITRSPVLREGDYLFKNLPAMMDKDLGCIYYHVSDSAVPLEAFEKEQGIRGYRHVILEIYRGASFKPIRYPFWHRMSSLF